MNYTHYFFVIWILLNAVHGRSNISGTWYWHVHIWLELLDLDAQDSSFRYLALSRWMTARHLPWFDVLCSAVAIWSPVSSRNWVINILCCLLRGHGFVKYFWRRSVHEGVLSNEPNHLSRFWFTYLVIVFFTWRALAGFAGPYFGCVCGHRHFKSAVKAYFQVIVYSLLLPDGLSQSVKWRRREPHPPYDICSAIYCIISQEYEFFYVIYLLPTDDYLMVARGDDFPLNSIYFLYPIYDMYFRTG